MGFARSAMDLGVALNCYDMASGVEELGIQFLALFSTGGVFRWSAAVWNCGTGDVWQIRWNGRFSCRRPLGSQWQTGTWVDSAVHGSRRCWEMNFWPSRGYGRLMNQIFYFLFFTPCSLKIRFASNFPYVFAGLLYSSLLGCCSHFSFFFSPLELISVVVL